MRPPTFRLRTALSKGPYVTRDYETSEETDSGGTECGGCRSIPARNAVITKVAGVWWHASCAARWLRELGADDAWLLLGQRLANAPSHFGVLETKAIALNLLRIAGHVAGMPISPIVAFEPPKEPSSWDPGDLPF